MQALKFYFSLPVCSFIYPLFLVFVFIIGGVLSCSGVPRGLLILTNEHWGLSILVGLLTFPRFRMSLMGSMGKSLTLSFELSSFSKETSQASTL